MDPSLIYKALSNETRRQIMVWLKDPEQYFDKTPYIEHGIDFCIGVCVSDIQTKAELAQSVVSNYLLTMQKAGLLEAERYGKWTFYRRNEKTIQQFAEYIRAEL
ncbi:ArsR family transcriptional regulator [Paenibacillus sp. A3]|uniref:ArsR/SmtB family transcription factor n=1 Tax=Paenibacillus sp. A3 TaxID=1337054 RepID=UPI0006D53288|nr:helix-turn-helix transcriptional regulator [Paenibacillus sp. A3]KPV55753.1 ArsR family transcriptional regulator [Paenibacillus sp. A3]